MDKDNEKAIQGIYATYYLNGAHNMIEDTLKRLERKERLNLCKDYVPLRMELEQIDTRIAEQLRDDLWKHRNMKTFIDKYVSPGFIKMQGEYEGIADIQGYFEGKGLVTPAKEIVARVRELLRAAGYTTEQV